MIFKNTASQKLTVFAFADAGHAMLDPGEPVTGDAANISCKVEQDDDGTQSATNDVAPTEVEDGHYRFDLTQAETNGDKLTFYPESSTAGVQVVALPSMVIYTRPPNFSALGIESDGDVTKVNTLDGHTAQTGDSFARIGANGAGLTQVILKDGSFTEDKVNTFLKKFLDFDGNGMGGSTSDADTFALLVAAINDLRDGGRLDVILDELTTQGDTNETAIGNLNDFDPANDAVANVTLVGTTTTNTDMRGTDNAALASVATEARLAELDAGNIPADIDTLLSRVTSTLFSGITSLAEWLGLMAGKQSADATALTEIKATGAGSGTYDESTDSQEAIRDTAPLGTAMRGTDGANTTTPPTAAAISDAVWTETIGDHSGTSGSTAEALDNATAPTAAAVADAVWTELIVDHSGVSGSTAEQLAAAGASGDPWNTALPGSYASGKAGYILGNVVSDVWSNSSRTLTQSATSISNTVSGSSITTYRGDTLSATITGLGSIADREKLWFTVKNRNGDPADTASLIMVDTATGLVYINGSAAGTAANGSIVVDDEDTGSITITVAAVEMAKLDPSDDMVYDVQILRNGTGNDAVATLDAGTFDLTEDVTKATS